MVSSTEHSTTDEDRDVAGDSSPEEVAQQIVTSLRDRRIIS